MRDADTYNKTMMKDARNVRTTALKKLQHQPLPPLASFDPLEPRLMNQFETGEKINQILDNRFEKEKKKQMSTT